MVSVSGDSGIRGRLGRSAVAIALICWLVLTARSGLAAESTARFLDGLRTRRLYSLAETYCLERLRPEQQFPRQLTSAEEIELTIELAKTFGEHGEYVTGSEQRELWQRASQLLAESERKFPQPAVVLRLRSQGALNASIEADWLRWQAELSPFEPQLTVDARKRLAEATQSLEAAITLVQGALKQPQRERSPATEIGLAAYELRGLESRLQVRLALMYIGRAHLADGRAIGNDRAAQEEWCQRAESILVPQAEKRTADDLVWRARILLVESLRIRNDITAALKRMTEFERQQPPAEILSAFAAQKVQIALAENRLPVARATLELFRPAADSNQTPTGRLWTGELALLEAQLLAREWKDAERSHSAPEVKRIFAALEEQVERSRNQVGGYWSLRCALVLQEIRYRAEYGPAVAVIVRKAETELSAAKVDQAIELYREAARAAEREQRAALAFQLEYRAGSLLIETKKWDAARQTFQELVRRYPEDPQAANAHLLAAYSLGKLAELPGQADSLTRYVATLEEHRRIYADKPTAVEATWMLAHAREKQGSSGEAYKLYEQIPDSHPRGPAARVAMACTLVGAIDEQRRAKKPTAEWEELAKTRLRGWLETKGKPPGKLTLSEMELALRLARVLLEQSAPDFQAADDWLGRVVSSVGRVAEAATTPAEAIESESRTAMEIQSEALRLRIVSLAGQGKLQGARELLHRVAGDVSPTALLWIVEGLAPLTSDPKTDPHRDLAELQLDAAKKLEGRRKQLSRPEQRRLDLALAQAYSSARQLPEAIKIYEQLLQATPNDKPLLMTYVAALRRCGTAECLKSVVTAWRRLESQHPAGSAEWLAARYEFCRGLLDLGQSDAARKLIKITRILYPKLGGQELADKFAELERRSELAK